MTDPEPRLFNHGRNVARYPWPADCMIQGSRSGLVFVRGTGDTYTTAFFEAFPRELSTFIRGEGADLIAAEDAAWLKYQRILTCPGIDGHEYEPRGYKNGAGFCKHCGLFTSNVYTPTELGMFCGVCSEPTFWTVIDGTPYCEEHNPKKAEYDAAMAALDRDDLEPVDDAEFDAAIGEVLTRLSGVPVETPPRDEGQAPS